MTFNTWIAPLLDYYKNEREILTDYIRSNKHGTFSVYDQQEATNRFRCSVRYLYKVRDRAEALASLYEVLVHFGFTE